MNMDPFIVLLNVVIPLIMTVQVNFYFNSVFGKEKSKPTKWLYILAFLIANVLFLNVPLPLLGFNLLMMAAIFCLSLGFESERSEEHTSELQSRENLVCRLLLEKKK